MSQELDDLDELINELEYTASLKGTDKLLAVAQLQKKIGPLSEYEQLNLAKNLSLHGLRILIVSAIRGDAWRYTFNRIRELEDIDKHGRAH